MPLDEPVNSADSLRQALRTHLPSLDSDLQIAVSALQRLQRLAKSSGEDERMTPSPLSPNGLLETADFGAESIILATTDDSLRPAPMPSYRRAQPLKAGESFGRFQITRQLGEGAMGAVYLAYDPQLQRYVALKTPFLADDPAVVQRFFREARSAAQIRSPYVCPIYEVGSFAGVPCLAMAYIEGRSLARWLRDEVHTLYEVVGLFSKIASGLQKAHAHAIIHRDLKPDNIMVDSDGDPIIMDFGLARRVDDETQVTSPGGLLGTPAYMSPEQIRGEQDKIGPQSDLYSLGVVLYEALTGALPFQGSLMTVLHKVIHEEPAPPSAVQPTIPPGAPIEQICLKMMAKRPTDRYAGMAEVTAAFQQLPRPQTPQTASSRPRASLWSVIWRTSRSISTASKRR
jgi:serine/threonine protein kinase